jgi:nucleoside-diphosphate-sugar epimerase
VPPSAEASTGRERPAGGLRSCECSSSAARGLISRGIVKHLLARGAEVRAFNRGKSVAPPLPAEVRTVLGDRDDADAISAVAGENFDIVIDMVCFRNEQAAAAVAAFDGKCRHYIFCSTVCTYGTNSPSTVLIDESSPQQPTSGYGRDKVACEQTFFLRRLCCWSAWRSRWCSR